MGKRRAKVKDVDIVIGDIFDEYVKDAADMLEDVIPKVAKEDVKMLKTESPRSGRAHSRRKPYADSWTVTTEKTRVGSMATIHNNVPGLPHLLEHGHLLRNGMRGGQRVHIQPVADKLEEIMQKEVSARFERG